MLDNISDGLITESRAETGCGIFIQINKEESKNVLLRNNNTAKSAKEINYKA
jgi:hypothetical protein